MVNAGNPDVVVEVRGNVVDLEKRFIGAGVIRIHGGRIAGIEIVGPEDGSQHYIVPGFVDAHIHIESSMLVPTEFARLATVHGTVGTVSDPHEIANVLGRAGVEFMLENAEKTPLKIMFGAPPCVPATRFETSGATLSPEDVRGLLADPRVGYLAEVMNYPGVIAGDVDLLTKIKHAVAADKPCDGHAPGLRGSGVKDYFGRGITTDHECFTLEEAIEKLECDSRVQILIREGSAAKNFAALHPLLRSHPGRVMLCSDDRHPNDLEEGHMNLLVARAIEMGYDVFDVLRAVSVNPVKHYKLPIGLLRIGDAADFLEVSDLRTVRVIRTFIEGVVVAEEGKSLLPAVQTGMPNVFRASVKKVKDFRVLCEDGREVASVHVMKAFDGQLVTSRIVEKLAVESGEVLANVSRDILKIAVVNRYADARPAVGFIQGFKMKRGAIASSVAHDSHNIVAVGVSDEEIMRAVNLIIGMKGGLAVVDDRVEEVLGLPVGGIMTNRDGREVAEGYRRIDAVARGLAVSPALGAPFMTLSFMALLVIPSLKLSDQGLFDGDQFQFVPVIEEGG